MFSTHSLPGQRSSAKGAVLLAIALLAGCAAGRNSVKPDAVALDPQTLDAGSAISRAAPERSQPASASWWKAYGDHQLDDLVDMALAHNPTMDMAAARIRQAQGVFDRVHADTLPNVTGAASIAGERFSNNYGWGPYGGTSNTNNQLLVGADYHFDFWGKRRAQVAASQGHILASRAEAQDAALMLQTGMVQTYIQLASAYRLRDVAQQGLDRRGQILKLATIRQGAGLGDDIDTTSLRASISDTRSVVAQLDGQINRLRHAVAALAGKDPSYAEAITRPELTRLGDPAPISRLPADLLGHRPDVTAARERAEAASQGIRAAKAAFYPDIDLSLFAGAQRLGLSDFLSAGSLAAGIVPAISLPIFDGGRLRGQLTARTADYDAAVSDYNATLLRALQETADGVTDLQAASRQQSEAADRVAQQRRLADLQDVRAKAHLANQIDVLNTDIAALLAQRDAITADTRVAVSQVALIRALGGTYSTSSSDSQHD